MPLNMGVCDVSRDHVQVVYLGLGYRERWLRSFHDLTLGKITFFGDVSSDHFVKELSFFSTEE